VIKNPIPWPGGARCAVAFTFDMDAESLMHLYFPDTAPNRVAMAAMLRYDAQVAVPRLLHVLARYQLRQTFFVPGWCIETYPQTIDAILTAGTSSATTATCTRSSTSSRRTTSASPSSAGSTPS